MALRDSMHMSDEEIELVSRLRRALRLWAHARSGILPIIEQTPKLAAFDRAMFALGELAWGSEGEVTNVERLD